MRLGGSILAHDRVIDPEAAHERLRAVTAEDVRDAAREILDPARLTVAIVGPNPDEKMLKKLLAA
jgi:predicted Zn-dependent peptidase